MHAFNKGDDSEAFVFWMSGGLSSNLQDSFESAILIGRVAELVRRASIWFEFQLLRVGSSEDGRKRRMPTIETTFDISNCSGVDWKIIYFLPILKRLVLCFIDTDSCNQIISRFAAFFEIYQIYLLMHRSKFQKLIIQQATLHNFGKKMNRKNSYSFEHSQKINLHQNSCFSLDFRWKKSGISQLLVCNFCSKISKFTARFRNASKS